MSPFLSALQSTTCVLSGTNMSVAFLQEVVVPATAVPDESLKIHGDLPFMDEKRMAWVGSTFFHFQTTDFDGRMLEGRCRFFMRAVSEWLSSETKSFQEAIYEVVGILQHCSIDNSIGSLVQKFAQKYKGESEVAKCLGQLLMSFLNKNETSSLILNFNAAPPITITQKDFVELCSPQLLMQTLNRCVSR